MTFLYALLATAVIMLPILAAYTEDRFIALALVTLWVFFNALAWALLIPIISITNIALSALLLMWEGTVIAQTVANSSE